MEQCNFLLRVLCLTYNHAYSIVDTMNGFTMQQTTFPYVCCILDDASIDGEPDVIRHYLCQNFELTGKEVKKQSTEDYNLIFARHRENKNCYFAVFLLKYNHYSIKKKKMPYIREYCEGISYFSLCEGDDYWTDPLKLQRQINFMENHNDCTMTCTRAKRYSELRKQFLGEQYCRRSSGFLRTEDIINRTGIYIPTCSIVYRPYVIKDYPSYCQNCDVGDYPLQIMAAMKGNVFYFDNCTCVYRIENTGSWTSRQKFESIDPARLEIVYGQTKMFEGFAKDYPQYEHVLSDKISEHILKNMPRLKGINNKDGLSLYNKKFCHEFEKLTFKWKLFYIVCKLRVPYIKKIYHRTILRKYNVKIEFYNSLMKRLLDAL